MEIINIESHQDSSENATNAAAILNRRLMQQENEEIAHFKDTTQKQMTFQNTKQNEDSSNFNNVFAEPTQMLSHNHTHTFAAAAAQGVDHGLDTPPMISSAAPMASPQRQQKASDLIQIQ